MLSQISLLHSARSIHILKIVSQYYQTKTRVAVIHSRSPATIYFPVSQLAVVQKGMLKDQIGLTD